MLSLNEIRKYYPESLHGSGSFLLREYLQHKILQLIYESEFADDLVFMGGTCLRIAHDNQRFSEDLDFDNLRLSDKNFSALAEIVRKGLRAEGYNAEMKVVHKTAFHCYIRMPGLLYDYKLSPHKDATITIRIDTEPQLFKYEAEKFLLNRFDVFVTLNITPLSLLMAQKCRAILDRKRMMGRDLYDVVFLTAQKVEPDFHYLKQKDKIATRQELRDRLSDRIQRHDLKKLAADVEPFLFHPKEISKVLHFAQVIEQYFR